LRRTGSHGLANNSRLHLLELWKMCIGQHLHHQQSSSLIQS
jgi:hypothetical protein